MADDFSTDVIWTPDGPTDDRYDTRIGSRLVDSSGNYLVDINHTRIFLGFAPFPGQDVSNSGVWTASDQI